MFAVIVVAAMFLGNPIAFAQEKPEPPVAPTPADAPKQPSGQKNGKKESGNPTRYAYEAADATKHMGELALVKARDWESGWFTGVFVPKGGTITSLTFAQRREYYLQQTLATPGAYMKRMFSAGVDQALRVAGRAIHIGEQFGLPGEHGVEV